MRTRWSGRDGYAKPAGANAGEFEPMSIAEIAAIANNTGGPIAGHHEVNADGAGVSFGVHLVDLRSIPRPGLPRFCATLCFRMPAKAVHPSYVEGQMQGGSVQGIGWALNEEYIYGEDGLLQIRVFWITEFPWPRDLPPIEAVILEIPNPGHPYGVRGRGRDLDRAAAGGADQCGVRVPLARGCMSCRCPPPRILKAIKG